ncbi:MAG: peptidoglycan editing factor PgeF [Anaerolineaceae bacterium]
MIQHDVGGLRYYTFETFQAEAIDHAVFTRLGGQSKGPYASLNLGGTVGDNPDDVLANHRLLFGAFGRPYESRFDVWQVHGSTLLFTDKPRPVDKKHQPADGIFTDNPDVTLMMRFADCVPLVFHDPMKRVIGLVHAGWQGTLLQIGAEAVRMLQEKFASDPADLLVGIGPSICGDCYQVSEDLRKRFLLEIGQATSAFFREKDNGLYLDLWAANEWTLRNAGVLQIEQSQICTASHLNEWYSYRKEKGVTGRFATVIALKHDGRSA